METLKKTVFVANDLGNGYIKEWDTNGQKRNVVPSVIAEKQTMLAPNTSETNDEYMDNFLDKLDVSISSSMVERTGRFLVGIAASKGMARKQGFDVYSDFGKAQDDLSLILTLSTIAGTTIQENYKKGEDIFKPITIDVYMTTALPIAEARDRRVAEEYIKKYTGQKHIVTFHNFKDPIVVTVKFASVKVYLEGETASVALANAVSGLKGFPELDRLKDVVIKDYKEHYPERAEKYGVEEPLSAQNILLLDIGAKTFDPIVTTNGLANPEASDSINLGYDTILEKLRQESRIKGLGNFSNRFELKEYLKRNLVGANAEKQETMQRMLDEQIDNLTKDYIEVTSHSLSMVGNEVDVIYIVGGGATPACGRSHFRENLQELVKNMGSTAPVILVDDPELAQDMNLLGLRIMLSVLKKSVENEE